MAILAHSKIASSCLVTHDFAPSLVDNTSFAEAYRAAKERDIAERNSHVLSLPAGKKKNAKLSTLRRLGALWKKSSPFIYLQGNLLPNAEIARSPGAKAAALGTAWSSVFSALPRSEQEVDTFVNRHIKDWKLEIPPPSLADF